MLDDAYRAIETCPQNLKITVAAFTDSVGDPTAKQIISRTRAHGGGLTPWSSVAWPSSRDRRL